MVRHPVEYHTESQGLGFSKKSLEILHCTELRINGAIVLYGIVGTESPLTLLFSDRVNRHKPDNVHAEFLQARELGLGRSKSALRSVLAHIHFINDGIVSPCGMWGLFRTGR